MNNLFLYAVTVFIWGSTWYAITFQLGVVDPILSVSYRFALAACALYIYLLFTRKERWKNLNLKRHFFIALQGSLFFCTNYIFIYYGSQYITSGLVAVLFSSLTLINIFNEALLFKKRIRRQVLVGSIIGFIGIIAVFLPEITSLSLESTILKGSALCIISAYFASLGNMVAVRNSEDNISIMESNTLGMAYGALFSFLYAFTIGIEINFDFSVEYVSTLIYLAVIGSSVSFSAYLALTRNIGADKAVYVSVLAPIIALIISTIFEEHIWTLNSALGAVLILIGNLVAMRAERRKT